MSVKIASGNGNKECDGSTDTNNLNDSGTGRGNGCGFGEYWEEGRDHDYWANVGDRCGTANGYGYGHCSGDGY